MGNVLNDDHNSISTATIEHQPPTHTHSNRGTPSCREILPATSFPHLATLPRPPNQGNRRDGTLQTSLGESFNMKHFMGRVCVVVGVRTCNGAHQFIASRTYIRRSINALIPFNTVTQKKYNSLQQNFNCHGASSTPQGDFTELRKFKFPGSCQELFRPASSVPNMQILKKNFFASPYSASPFAWCPEVRPLVSAVRRGSWSLGHHVPGRLFPDPQLHQLFDIFRDSSDIRAIHFGK